jgi:hypothetical protein
MIDTTERRPATAAVDDPMAEAMVHFLTHHSEPTLVVLPVDWLPRNGRHWYLFPDVDVLALSMERWECGAVDAVFEELGIRLRLPRLGERPPARSRCPLCSGPQRSPAVPGRVAATRHDAVGQARRRPAARPMKIPQSSAPATPRRPTVNDLGLLRPRSAR